MTILEQQELIKKNTVSYRKIQKLSGNPFLSIANHFLETKSIPSLKIFGTCVNNPLFSIVIP